jgi:hypothetical protein
MNDLGKFVFWRKHLLHFLFAIIALVLFSLALLAHKDAEKELASAKNLFAQQQATNLQAEQSAALLDEYLAPYQLLQKKGVIAQPKRLEWLEALTDQINSHLLPLVNFTLSSSENATETNTVYKNETIAVKVTPMKLDFSLLHEGDFYRLFDELHKSAKGLFSAQQCIIERSELDKDGKNTLISADFSGKCDLLWYSLADITLQWEVVNEPVLHQ